MEIENFRKLFIHMRIKYLLEPKDKETAIKVKKFECDVKYCHSKNCGAQAEFLRKLNCMDKTFIKNEKEVLCAGHYGYKCGPRLQPANKPLPKSDTQNIEIHDKICNETFRREQN